MAGENDHPDAKMYSIRVKFRSHIHLKNPDANQSTVSEVRRDRGLRVTSFEELVHAVAKVSHWNRQLNLFFRGQDKEYYHGVKPRILSILPEIYRPPRGQPELHRTFTRSRFKTLRKCEKYLKDNYNLQNRHIVRKYREVQWALLQHYKIFPTPLLDITQSLRVAATIATESKETGDGILYVFGLPHVKGSITYEVDEDIMLLKLQSICPPEASRPHFQEGYLVGTYPPREGSVGQNVAARLIAKFRLPRRKFWDDAFTPIPKTALMPEDDDFLDLVNKMKTDLR